MKICVSDSGEFRRSQSEIAEGVNYPKNEREFESIKQDLAKIFCFSFKKRKKIGLDKSF